MIPYDKQLHFVAGFTISAIVSLLALRVGHDPWIGFVVACAAGLMKESYDRTGRGQKDFLDFWWTGLGGVVAPLVIEMLVK